MPVKKAASQATLNFTLATAGHVDHGKTSLLRALTGIDPDRLKEEKEREMTTDIGFAHIRLDRESLASLDQSFPQSLSRILRTDTNRHEGGGSASETGAGELVVGFIDVPGHGKFLKNMLAGVGGIDLALLVVAADEGPMPQTVQHVKILSLLGVKSCILAVTKIDLAAPEQLAAGREEAEALAGRFGIKVLDTIEVDNVSQRGMIELKRSIVARLMEHPLADRRRDLAGTPLPPYLPIDRIFSKSGYGAVVTGTLIEGEIRIGDSVAIEPGNIMARVRGLETFNRQLECAFPGQRLAVNLSVKEHKPVERGQAIVAPGTRPVSTVMVALRDLGGLESRLDSSGDRRARKLKPQLIRFYHGTAERSGFLSWNSSPPENGSHEINDGLSIGQVQLHDPLVIKPEDDCVIRYGDYGIAGGKILLAFDSTSRPRWLSRKQVMAIALLLLQGKTGEAVMELIGASPGKALSLAELASILSSFKLRQTIDTLCDSGAALVVGDLVVASGELTILAARVKEVVAAADAPVPQEKLRVDLAPLLARPVFQHLISVLVEKQEVTQTREGLLPGGGAARRAVSQDCLDAAAKVGEFLIETPIIEVKELSVRLGLAQPLLAETLKYMEERQEAHLVNYEFVASPAFILEAHRVLGRIFQRNRVITPSDFRQELSVSRKYTMALLAYFDDELITRRLPAGRVLVKAAPRQ